MRQVTELSYFDPGVSCSHCVAAVTDEIQEISGVEYVEVDLARKQVTVRGSSVDDTDVRAAIEAAGYEVAS
jgi:copper chaperone